MDRSILISYILNGCPETEWDNTIYEYCIDKGKDADKTNTLLNALDRIDPFGRIKQKMVSHIMTNLAIEYNLLCLYDKNNQLIGVY